jgi:hypothetical protein
MDEETRSKIVEEVTASLKEASDSTGIHVNINSLATGVVGALFMYGGYSCIRFGWALVKSSLDR